MLTLLAEQLAPVRPHTESDRVLQRGRLVPLAARDTQKPADVLLALTDRLTTFDAHVSFDGPVLEVVPDGVGGRPTGVDLVLHRVQQAQQELAGILHLSAAERRIDIGKCVAQVDEVAED